MRRFWKFWLAAGANVMAAVAVGIAMNTGLGVCTGEPSAETCTLLGFTSLQIYATLNTVLAPLLVAAGPANQP